ncbi:Bifunctional purine biosynthetic protein ade1 [Elasticomyces elasticus]|nr:Bifunctional purine biosynthetic protein ade1 [Elasticomyces elasticus]KAK3662137.1 Bifunctional purine biosynthetic protein ade1 [Elasticomyces elasticus]KAK4927501.1 Bifunctional purine biosynthetic protein ade1 [Elasticomyces elasticus]KAK5749755.1 Bifunctional purine biosynthetic protein ade1 [Elasticomyces elasticus]
MSTTNVVTTIDAKDVGLKKIASGKVREIFEVDANTLLFVATDRISAYDVILENGIPNKGPLLTQLSAHWFDLIRTHIPDLRLHVVSLSLPNSIPANMQPLLASRSMQVRYVPRTLLSDKRSRKAYASPSPPIFWIIRHPILPLESIVRGYITGSAWNEYRASGTVNGMSMPEGLKESQKLDIAIWTPSTKADAGEHDENISKERAAEILGEEVAKRVERVSLRLYELTSDYAEKRGILIADTKFEFGLDAATNELVLVDEVLTPDSSRFWPKGEYEVGRGQGSYDKQYLRDWLTTTGNKGKEGVRMPDEVVKATTEKYTEAFEMLTGRKWE